MSDSEYLVVFSPYCPISYSYSLSSSSLRSQERREKEQQERIAAEKAQAEERARLLAEKPADASQSAIATGETVSVDSADHPLTGWGLRCALLLAFSLLFQPLFA